MKILILLIFISNFILADTRTKQILIERLTNASSENCEKSNKKFIPFAKELENDIVILTYHFHNSSFYDPIGIFSLEITESRINNYYNVKSFPYGIVNGLEKAYLDNFLNLEPSNEIADISIEQTSVIDDKLVTLFTEVEILNNKQEFLDQNVRLFAVLKEKLIVFNEPPGFNNETEFYDVVRYMFDSPSGFMIDWDDGKAKLEFSQEVDLETIDPNQLYTAVFVQNIITGEVYQANEIKVDILSNIDENNSEHLKLIPNPSNDKILVKEVNSGENFNIINSLGEKVLSGIYKGSINISELNPGTYFLNINSKSLKFIKY